MLQAESVSVTNVHKADSRPKWDNKIQYILMCIGFAVGLGNVWRFPYLCQTYGGGAFLIPYILALVFQGIPLFHLELAIGQYLRKGSIGAWTTISPYLGGIGYCSLMTSFLISLYYNMILAWVLWYLMNSFKRPLPWSTCPLNDNTTEPIEECRLTTSANYFWYRETLNITSDISESGSLQPWLVWCLAICWAIVFLCVSRGIETAGKVIYVTTLFPYVTLTIFLIKGLTLPGAIEGLTYLITPKVKHLKNPRVWLAAATQIFFSLSLGIGGHIAYASYNPVKNDCERDSVIVAIVNSGTSLYATIPIFSILGFKATMGYHGCLDRNIAAITSAFNLTAEKITRDNYTTSVNVLNKVDPNKMAGLKLKKCSLEVFLDESVSGTGLAFIVFTEVAVHMSGSQIWAILFFVMLFTLGLSSMFGLIESILTPLFDYSPVVKYMGKEAISGIVCLVCFLLALSFTQRSGNYWLEVFDSYAGSIPLLIVGFFEMIAVIYVYGFSRFNADVKWMTGRYPNLYWQATWRIITPMLMVTIFLAYLMTQGVPVYSTWNPNYEHFPTKEIKHFPKWVMIICILLVSLPCTFIPIVAIFEYGRTMVKSNRTK